MGGIIEAVIDSILPTKEQPVVPNAGLIRAMDLSFLGLLLTLIGLFFLTQANLHVLALMLVAICLWVSVRWFVAELGRMNHLNKPIQNLNLDSSSNDPVAQPLAPPTKVKSS